MESQILIVLGGDGSLKFEIAGAAAQNELLALGLLDKVRDLLLHPPEPASPIAIARGSLPLSGPNGR